MALPFGHILWGASCSVIVSPVEQEKKSIKDYIILGLGICFASLLPDIDWIPRLWMAKTEMMNIRHGFTHGILFASITAIPFWYFISHRRHLRHYLSWVCLIWGHGILDCFYQSEGVNNGVALLSPFSSYRFYFPIIPSFEFDSVLELFTNNAVIRFMFIEAAACFLILGIVWCIKKVVFGDLQWHGLRINPYRLILIRIYNMGIGRFPWGDKMLRVILLRLLILKKKKAPYCQSSDFFTYDQLEKKL